MNSIKHILVPTDFSDTAHNALHSALILARHLGAHITLVHFYYQAMPLDVLGQPIYLPNEREWKVLQQEALEKLAKIKHQASLSFPNVKMRLKNEIGDISVELSQLCAVEDVDMIVCGTNGTDKIGELFWGTNTTAIVDHMHTPVLVVPRHASFTKLHKIVFATDFHYKDEQVITVLASALKPFFPLINVVHVSEVHPKFEEAFVWLQEVTGKDPHYPHITFHHIKGKPSFHVMEEYLQNEKADLLVLTTKGKNIFERIASGSLSREMICHSHFPLLIYHTPSHPIG